LEVNKKNIRKEMARQLGSVGGKKSAEVRLGGLTKEQKSELMRKVRYSKKETKELDYMAEELVKGLNSES